MAAPRQTTPLLLLLVAGLVGYMGYSGTGIGLVGVPGVKGTKDSIAFLHRNIDSLQVVIDSARKLLKAGTVEDLRRQVEADKGALELLRRLVPERNEVPNLLDDISTRAKIRGVAFSGYSPLPEEAGPAPFSTFKYQISVTGHFDQIGEFLSDVASLQRIIVPIELTLTPAAGGTAKLMGDSTGALLEAKFQVRTYVKTASQPEGGASGT